MRALGLLLCGLAGCGFGTSAAFTCATDDNCTGGPAAGRCETDLGVCSFADDRCNSGWRYGDNSGGVAGRCVGETPNDQDGGNIDTPPGMDTPPIDARLCFGGPHEICLTSSPSQAVTLPALVDTTDASSCTQVVSQTGGPDLCVIAGTQITVASSRVIGSRPLVLVASDTIKVNGVLDASSKRDGANNRGAGANAAACSVAGNGEDDSGGGGGGGGGGFGGKGGDAGKGDTNTSGGNDGDSNGGPGGIANSSTFIRGGCRGGDGGDGSNNGANGSDGGGALYLIAAGTITVDGAIYASGAGGNGGASGSNGGGGAGSGGLIGLDAIAINVTGTIAANGGGGGGGGGTSNGGNGGDGTTTNYDQRATAGTGGNQNPPPDSPGGRGTTGGTVDGEGTVGSAGGSGGGGGGIGVLWVHGTLTGTKISPSPTTI